MRKTFARVLLLACVAAVPLLGCNKGKTSTGGMGSSSPAAGGGGARASTPDMPPDTVVATIGGEPITAGQLDEKVRPQLRQLEEEANKQKFQLRKQRLDELVMDRLVETEAKKRSLTKEQLIKAEIDDKIQQPSEEEIKKLFDQSSSRLPPGSTIETYRGQISDFLTRNQKREKSQALFDKLRKDYNVEIKLSEPRKQVEAKGPSRGPDNAKVTIVEFSDFECPFCSRAVGTVDQVMQAYPGKVRLVFRQFPLSFHPHAAKAAEAALCANEQKRFWEYHDTLFKNQKALEVPQLKEHAKSVGLDEKKFAECLDSGRLKAQVEEDTEAGSAAGVSGTPAFFINGVSLSGAQPMEEFKKVIDQELGG